MDKSPVTYKRRRSGRPLSEISWNVEDALLDPESEVSLLESDDAEDTENVTPAKKNRKIWSDQPHPGTRTRSSTALLEDTSLKGKASKWVGALFGKKDKDKGKGVERSPPQKWKAVETTPTPKKGKQTNKESPMGGALLYSPIEFVKEKQAMFAEIDAFELESEEEDPKADTAEHIAEALNSSEEAVQGGSKGSKGSNTESEQSPKEVTSIDDAPDKEKAVRKEKAGDKDDGRQHMVDSLI